MDSADEVDGTGTVQDKDMGTEPSNAEVARLIEQALIRFQNWRTEVEINPNPRMVHSLRNLMSIVDALTTISEKRMQYSYKSLLSGMARLVNETARLNNAVVASLEDDRVAEDELRTITDQLVALVNSAVGLIRLVQESFAIGDARTGRLLEASTLPAERAPAVRSREQNAGRDARGAGGARRSST